MYTSSIDSNNQEQVNQAAVVFDERTVALGNAVRRIIDQLRVMRDEGRLHPADFAVFESILEDVTFGA